MVLGTHATNVSMLRLVLLVLNNIKKANMKVSDIHALNVSLLQKQLVISSKSS